MVLDEQVKYLEQKSLVGLGHWLIHRWEHCQSRKREAQEQLQQLGLDLDTLHQQWQEQVTAQTKLAPSECFGIETFH